jgi:hypothetical protein
MGKRDLLTTLLAAGTLCGACASLLEWPIFPFGICAYLLLSVIPGAALYRLASREPGVVEGLVCGLALSPVLTTSAAALAMLAGVPSRASAALLVVLAGALAIVAFRRSKSSTRPFLLTGRQAFALAALLLLVSAATSYPAFAREWWRVRADAWFHCAVFAQVRDFGIPPEDPYYIGFPLQYMWLYHVFLVVLNRASGVGPFITMALINVQALFAFGLATYALSTLLKKSFMHSYGSVLTAIFGMNAVFWVFLPVKLLRTFAGEVRGADEVRRILSIHPFDATSVREFVIIANNVAWLLDKFMVATALSMGLALMAVAWYGATAYVNQKRPESALAACLAAYGIVCFHTALGVPFFAGIVGGLCLATVFRRRLGIDDARPFVHLLLFLLVSGAAAVPYLYSVTHAKSGPGAIPLALSGIKMFGILVSCALVIFAAAFQAKALVAARTAATRLILCATLALLGVSAVIQLPGPNTGDKVPFLLFYPLAVVAGWSLADFANRARNARGRIVRYVLAGLFAFAPLNVFQIAGYYNTAPIYKLDEDDKKIAAWIRENTTRESIILDSKPGGFLLVAGPRRYYMANEVYAGQWSYDGAEIAKRRRVLDGLFASDSLDVFTLEALGAMPCEPVAILREGTGIVDKSKFEALPRLFEIGYSNGAISIIKIDRNACLELARRKRSEQ